MRKRQKPRLDLKKEGGCWAGLALSTGLSCPSAQSMGLRRLEVLRSSVLIVTPVSLGAPSDGPHQVTRNPLPPREPVTVSAFPAMSPQAQPLPEASLAYRGASMSRSKSRYGPRRSLEEK